MENRPGKAVIERLAGMMDAMGAPQRLRIMRLLLAAHPHGMPAGEIQTELGIPASTLSHHLEKLRQAGVVRVRREGTYLWYSADTAALEELLAFLYAECCTRSCAVEPAVVLKGAGSVRKERRA
ncbi:MAG: metalloregulator ArsR/SmtB family transcription factor [Bryobacteraceae bacterium]|nr:metalloregulator ArsR/SmtB family transcription factor [Bryobacteraceae bacterium]MCX7604715.1 metalloregulator ArsR/SmtB family transcription factor [Bryobacteraceae bacterium]